MLTCACYDDIDDAEWWYISPDDFTIFNSNRRKRCCSCRELIDRGSLCLEFDRQRHPRSEVEENIYGDGGEIQMAHWYMCEQCGEKYLNLHELGYCHRLGESMRDDMEEYWELTGFMSSSETVL